MIEVWYDEPVAPDMSVNPDEELEDDCQDHVIPGFAEPPTLKRFALNALQNWSGPAHAIPGAGVPEHGAAPPLMYME